MSFLFVDRIFQLESGAKTRGIKHIGFAEPYLYAQERPYFPPSLIGEALGQLAAWNVMQANDFKKRPVAGLVASASVLRPVYAGETLLLESFIDSLDEQAVQYHSQASVCDEIVFRVDGAIGPLLPMEEFIAEEQVRRQFSAIYRPSSWDGFKESQALQGSSTEKSILPFNLNQESCRAFGSSLMNFDRILESLPGSSLSAIKKVSATAPYFADHFPHQPVLPLTILLEAKQNLVRFFLSQSKADYEIVELRKIKMNDFVHPGDVVMTHLNLVKQTKEEMVLKIRSEVESKRVCMLELLLKAKGDS